MRPATLLFLLGTVLLSCGQRNSAPDASSIQPEAESADTVISEASADSAALPAHHDIDPRAANRLPSDMKAASKALVEAYPDFIERIADNRVIFNDGTSLTYDDGRVKDFGTLLDDGDIEDMFFVPYDPSRNQPEYLHDAGRSRNEALFKKMYGNSAAAVRRNLVKVAWFGKTVDFTAINGAADSLRKVAAELEHYPQLKKYLASSGTFYWRPVRGAKRLSAHSYGIAFDIAVPYSDYWLWKNKNAGETDRIEYANRFPRQIVEIFRRHGFIWGGAWYHFDTMHFEFRPEILHYSDHYGKH